MGFIEQILNELPADAPDERIESTASDLESMNYDPILMLKAPGFFRMNKAALGHEVDRVLQLAKTEASDAVKSKQVELLLYHYEHLCRLRLNQPEAWDVVTELQEDD